MPKQPTIDEIRARETAATPGHWGTEYDGNGTYYVHARLRTTPAEGMASDGVVAELHGEHGDGQTYANANFTAHARSDVPFLLQELADTVLTRDFHQNSARHLADKRDVAEEVLSEWEAGRLSPETALKMIRAALAVGEVKTLEELRTAVTSKESQTA
jgi:hypothetical protein